MPSNEYIRCHYSAPTGQECEIWFPKNGENDVFCPIHKGSLSAGLVSNGLSDKQEFYAHRDRTVQPLVEATAGMTDGDAASYFDAHIAGLEQAIEKLKLEAMHARALRQGKLEKLSDEERAERRKIRIERPEKVKAAKKTTGKLSNMTPDAMVQAMMARVPGMTEDGARKLLGLN